MIFSRFDPDSADCAGIRQAGRQEYFEIFKIFPYQYLSISLQDLVITVIGISGDDRLVGIREIFRVPPE
jgi:hypothetical protein